MIPEYQNYLIHSIHSIKCNHDMFKFELIKMSRNPFLPGKYVKKKEKKRLAKADVIKCLYNKSKINNLFRTSRPNLHLNQMVSTELIIILRL